MNSLPPMNLPSAVLTRLLQGLTAMDPAENGGSAEAFREQFAGRIAQLQGSTEGKGLLLLTSGTMSDESAGESLARQLDGSSLPETGGKSPPLVLAESMFEESVVQSSSSGMPAAMAPVSLTAFPGLELTLTESLSQSLPVQTLRETFPTGFAAVRLSWLAQPNGEPPSEPLVSLGTGPLPLSPVSEDSARSANGLESDGGEGVQYFAQVPDGLFSVTLSGGEASRRGLEGPLGLATARGSWSSLEPGLIPKAGFDLSTGASAGTLPGSSAGSSIGPLNAALMGAPESPAGRLAELMSRVAVSSTPPAGQLPDPLTGPSAGTLTGPAPGPLAGLVPGQLSDPLTGALTSGLTGTLTNRLTGESADASAVRSDGARTASEGTGGIVSASSLASSAVPSHQSASLARSVPLEVPFQQRDWDQALGQRIQWLVRENVQEARIRLNPREMGVIDIRIQVDGDRAHLQFVSAQANVREALDAALPRLREMFAEGGLSLGDVSVGRESPGRNGSSGEQAGSEGQGSDEPDAQANESLLQQSSLDRSLLDLYA